MIALKKGEKVKVVSQVMEWQGKTVLDIRTYVVASRGDQAGSWIPTGKGVQVPADKAERFLELALKDVRASRLLKITKAKTKKGSASK